MKNDYFKNETKNLILKGGIIIYPKEYENQRVVTMWDISEIHKKDMNDIKQTFQRNRNRFILNEDYFCIKKDEKLKPQNVVFKELWDFAPAMRELILLTEKGYFKIIKSFKDDLSWDIYEIMIESYFILKKVQKQEFLPQDYASALRKCADLYEEKLKLEESNQKLKTFELTMKAKFKSGKTYTTTELAKQFNIKSAHAMHKILEKLNLIENYFITDLDSKQIKIWKLTKDYQNKGYDYLENLSFKGKKYLKWTDKGIYLICNMLNDLELLDDNLDIITWNNKLNDLMYKANDKVEQIINNYYLTKNI